MRTQSAERPSSLGWPSLSAPQASARDPQLDPRMDRVLAARHGGRCRAGIGWQHVGTDGPLALHVERAAAQRRVDREDLAVAHLSDGARLRAVIAGDRHGDVQVDDVGRARVRQVLRRRPHQLPARDGFERRDRGPEAAAAEHEACEAHADAGLDRQDPAMGVVRGLEAEELLRGHGTTGCPSGGPQSTGRMAGEPPASARGAGATERRAAAGC